MKHKELVFSKPFVKETVFTELCCIRVINNFLSPFLLPFRLLWTLFYTSTSGV